MEIDGDVVTIDMDMSMEEVHAFEAFIRPRFEYIETIEVNDEGLLKTGALVALLVSLKKTKPDLSIPFLERRIFNAKGYGTMHWICHD